MGHTLSRGHLAVALAAAGIALAAGCKGSGPAEDPAGGIAIRRPMAAPEDVVATINDVTISRQDVEMALQELRATTEALGQRWTPLSDESSPDRYDLHDLVNDLVIAELRAQDAVARGLDREREVQQRAAYRFRTLFAQEWVRHQLDQVSVAEPQVEEFYSTNQVGFREPERIRLRQLVVSSEDQAKAALVKLLEGADFAAVATEVSARADAVDGPLTQQWVMRAAEKAAFAPNDTTVRDLRDPLLEQAAFAIDKVGGYSTYVKGADGNFHVFQLVERTAARQRPLVEVADNIRNFLKLQALEQATAALKDKGSVQVFSERLEGIGK